MVPSSYASLVYDAVMTVGISACQQRERFFTSDQLLETIRNQQFHGASGYVTLNNVTGTRDLVGLRYSITNVLLLDGDDNTNDGTIRFTAKKKIAVEFPDTIIDNLDGNGPYIFADGTSKVPPALPPVDIDLNLIHNGVRTFGWILMAVIIVSSLGCITFAFLYRDTNAVKISQPEFLMLISTGCFIMSLSIIPLSFQEPLSTDLLDIGCMAELYLFSFGFVLSFSALYCKLHRVNTLLKSAQQFRRIKIDARDVMSPLIKLLTINLVILLTWTFIDPLRWRRREIENSLDFSGRVTASYATCSGSPDKTNTERIFYTLYFAVNFVALVIANYESYQGRDLPTLYNEVRGIAICMFFLLETCVIGLPVLFTVKDDPTGGFIVQLMLICSVCLAILCPIFLPLWRKRGGRLRSDRRDVAVGGLRRSILLLSQPEQFMHVDTQAERWTITDQQQPHPEQCTTFGTPGLSPPEECTIVDTTSQSQLEECTTVDSRVPSLPGRLESINESKPAEQPSTDSIESLGREEGADSFASFGQQQEKGSPPTRRSRVSFVVDSAT